MPRNSVGTLQLQRNAVKPAKLAPNAVRTGHVLNGSLLAADFREGQIPQGPKGDKGDRGDRGATGPVGISGYEIVRVSTTVPANGSARAQAGCPSGKRVIGGAGNVQLLPSGVFVFTNLTGQQFYRRVRDKYDCLRPTGQRGGDLRERLRLRTRIT